MKQNPRIAVDIIAGLTFAEAVRLFAKTWRKRHGYTVPGVSHALSSYDTETGAWALRCAETGDLMARAIDGYAELAEDMPEEALGGSESVLEAMVPESGPITPHQYPVMRGIKGHGHNSPDATVKIKKRRVFIRP